MSKYDKTKQDVSSGMCECGNFVNKCPNCSGGANKSETEKLTPYKVRSNDYLNMPDENPVGNEVEFIPLAKGHEGMCERVVNINPELQFVMSKFGSNLHLTGSDKVSGEPDTIAYRHLGRKTLYRRAEPDILTGTPAEQEKELRETLGHEMGHEAWEQLPEDEQVMWADHIKSERPDFMESIVAKPAYAHWKKPDGTLHEPRVLSEAMAIIAGDRLGGSSDLKGFDETEFNKNDLVAFKEIGLLPAEKG